MKKIYFLFLIAGGLLWWGCDKNSLPAANNGSVGAAANDLLSDNTYKRLEIEIHHMPGFALSGQSVNNLQDFLATYLRKPGGIGIFQTEIPGFTATTTSLEDIKATEAENRTFFTTDSVIRVYILVTNGNFEDPNVLGVAYRNTSLCLFGKKIADHSGGLTQPSKVKLETTVLTHEIGHILGLVDVGSPMQTPHKDGQHGSHCTNENCLMYFAVETIDFLSFLGSGPVPTLDTDCKADLQANGGF